MTHLKAGDKAPEINTTDQNGNSVSSEQLKGQKYVLYFYPKDNTPGCTNEAKNLRDFYDEFKEKGYEVIGVSPDSEASHKKFAEKHNLPFPLLTDTDKEIMQAFGVWGEKKNFGKVYDGVHRTTFLIDERGTITEVFKKVKTKEHAEQIFACINE